MIQLANLLNSLMKIWIKGQSWNSFKTMFTISNSNCCKIMIALSVTWTFIKQTYISVYLFIFLLKILSIFLKNITKDVFIINNFCIKEIKRFTDFNRQSSLDFNIMHLFMIIFKLYRVFLRTKQIFTFS